MRPPDAVQPPEGGHDRSAGEASRRGDSTAAAWLAAEITAVEDKLRAARLTLRARGIIPRPAIRSATVQLVALDAAIGDLEVVRTMPAEVTA